MPRAQTYEFTAFTEDDLLNGAFEFGLVHEGQGSRRPEHEDEIDIMDIQWRAVQSPGQDSAGFGLKAEAPQPSLGDAAGGPASETFDLFF